MAESGGFLLQLCNGISFCGFGTRTNLVTSRVPSKKKSIATPAGAEAAHGRQGTAHATRDPRVGAAPRSSPQGRALPAASTAPATPLPYSVRSGAAGPLPSRRHLPPRRPGGGNPRLFQNYPPPHRPPPRPAPYLRIRASAPPASAPRPPRASRLRSTAGPGRAPAAPPTPAPGGQWAPRGLRAPLGPRPLAGRRPMAERSRRRRAGRGGAGRRQGAPEGGLPLWGGAGGCVEEGRARARGCRSSRPSPGLPRGARDPQRL